MLSLCQEYQGLQGLGGWKPVWTAHGKYRKVVLPTTVEQIICTLIKGNGVRHAIKQSSKALQLVCLSSCQRHTKCAHRTATLTMKGRKGKWMQYSTFRSPIPGQRASSSIEAFITCESDWKSGNKLSINTFSAYLVATLLPYESAKNIIHCQTTILYMKCQRFQVKVILCPTYPKRWTKCDNICLINMPNGCKCMCQLQNNIQKNVYK